MYKLQDGIVAGCVYQYLKVIDSLTSTSKRTVHLKGMIVTLMYHFSSNNVGVMASLSVEL